MDFLSRKFDVGRFEYRMDQMMEIAKFRLRVTVGIFNKNFIRVQSSNVAVRPSKLKPL